MRAACPALLLGNVNPGQAWRADTRHLRLCHPSQNFASLASLGVCYLILSLNPLIPNT